MKIKRIKVSGFKSFVDPTTLTLPSSVVGVVGPNGCGKSNIIDAIRWVMGEGSARNLRGDSMGDVIFNGSGTRKPVGKASVELVFDNSEHTVGGPHGAFAEISIRRTLSRDTVSEYFLNNTRCRRRDITDIFHGTGLGPRSYSIIEQGMVSRIVEARPEDLRAFVEETAGISRYKERRRETENRLRHTRENLQRVDDIRNELELALRRLQRQSQAARRHKNLKQEERLLNAQLLAMRWRRSARELAEVNLRVTRLETGLEDRSAALREQERQIEEARRRQSQGQEEMNRVQGESYRVGSEVAALEQRIEHARDTRALHQTSLQQVREDLARIEKQLHDDRVRHDETEAEIARREPLLDEQQQRLDKALGALPDGHARRRDWQGRWEAFARESQAPVRQQEVQQARIDSLNRGLAELQERLQRQQRELEAAGGRLAELDPAELQRSLEQHRDASAALEQALQEGVRTLDAERGEIDDLRRQLDDKRAQLAAVNERLASQRELQKAAMGGDDEALAQWLRETGLDRLPRLATEIRVGGGWERAVEQLLGRQLPALCVDSIERAAALPDKPADSAAALGLIERRPQHPDAATADPECLAHYVSCPGVALDEWLDGVYVAQTQEQALARRASLERGQCVVTRDGVIAGRGWLYHPPSREYGGVLEREHAIEEQLAARAALDTDITGLKSSIERLRLQRQELEQRQLERQRELGRHGSRQAELHSLLGRREGEVRQLQERAQKLEHEMDETRRRAEERGGELEHARQHLREAHDRRGDMEERRLALATERETLEKALGGMERDVDNAREAVHQAQLGLRELRGVRDSLVRHNERAGALLESVRVRESELLAEYDSGAPAVGDEQRQLDDLLQQRVQVEKQLGEVRDRVEQWEQRVRKHSEQRVACEQQLQEARDEVESARLARQETVTIRAALTEQAETAAVNLEQTLAALPADAAEDSWQQQLESAQGRIERIGPVNLVAIEEYEEHAERKEQLDQQAADLEQALQTLDNAIRKIDRETRSRFEDTFKRLNESFRAFFPRLFGGGNASLALTGDDMLSAGVTVLARPPGKRNSTIHLLSGGEKALTAVALLFALFELTPAPFCMLDEVDAPLDDANVERYCETLRTLAKKTQLIFITHNKITMESADTLIGVTMEEPGVSRLVTVNVGEALQMAAAQ